MDGNFSAEHMRCRSGDKDVTLSAGLAFMANPEAYRAHLINGKDTIQVHRTLRIQCSSLHSDRPAHATHTRPLSKRTQVVLILMLQGSEQPHAAMVSLFPPLWLTSRRERGMSTQFIDSSAGIICLTWQASKHGLQPLQGPLL